MKTKGKLIVIEGLDGSGKQTQASLLFKKFESLGQRVILTSFPNYKKESSVLVKKYLNGDYSTSFNKKKNLQFIRQISSFYAVDRLSSFMEEEHDGKSLMQHLEEGVIIICDRYTTSNILHQSGNLLNTKDIPGFIKWIEQLEYKDMGLPKPDVVLYLNVEPEVSIKNIKKRYAGKDMEDIHESIDHLTNVNNNKDLIIKTCGWKNVYCCYDNNMLTEDLIHCMVLDTLRSALGSSINQ